MLLNLIRLLIITATIAGCSSNAELLSTQSLADETAAVDDESIETSEVDDASVTLAEYIENDGDGDGVVEDDACPFQSTVKDEDKDGCEDDSDGDGVYDVIDACPEDTFEVADTNGDGCEDDSDGDGIIDDLDMCPDEVPEVDDNLDGCEDNGISLCTENPDAFICKIDWSLFGPASIFGGATNVTPTDTDGDGVIDDDDDCDDEPVIFYDENGDGCEDDTDGDGVTDWKDFCDDVAPSYDSNGNGCPGPVEFSMCMSKKDSYLWECNNNDWRYRNGLFNKWKNTDSEAECRKYRDCYCLNPTSSGYSQGYDAIRVDIKELGEYSKYILLIQRRKQWDDNNGYEYNTYYKVNAQDTSPNEWLNLKYKKENLGDHIVYWNEISSDDWSTGSSAQYWWNADTQGELRAFFDSYMMDEKQNGIYDRDLTFRIAGYEGEGGYISDWSQTRTIEKIEDIEDCPEE